MTGHPLQRASEARPAQGAPRRRRFLGGARAASLALLLLTAGCSTLEHQGVLSNALPAEAPKTLGADALETAERKQLTALYGGEYRWPKAERCLNEILARLAKVSDTPSQIYRVTILNSAVVNAFALPSGDIFVTRGLLALANDSSEVAAVMAHEIAHVTARHAYLRAEQEKTAAVIGQAARVIQSRQKGEAIEANSAQSIAGFSRQQELEADDIGIKSAAKAGFDPYGAVRFLSALSRSTELHAALMGDKSDSKPDIFATHPSTPERIADALQAARQIGAPGIGETGRGVFLASIDGMAFGDDPREGAIRGRRFIHPRLGFSFEAPTGFVLENSAKAVLGVADGGAEALRLDSVRATQAQNLTSYLTSGWIDGLMASSIKPGQVNGMLASFADARAGEWNFHIAVISYHNDIYRIIFAVKEITPETDARFTAAIDSFRPLTPEDAALAQPQKLKLVMAGFTDTAQSFAARMALTDRPLEQFLLLNGLESDKLKIGDSYKIVVN